MIKKKTNIINLFIGVISICIIIPLSLNGCSMLESGIKDIKGELIGNTFDISVYDNFGNNVLNVKGSKVSLEDNVIKTKSVDEDGKTTTTYDLSSVITNTIDGHNMEMVGNTVIYAESGLEMITDFELPSDIETSGGSINLIDRNINSIKNMIGTPKVVVIQSQLGVPIAVYGGEDVYYEIPSDLPKMTKLYIDGRALYIHRANYIILDTKMIE